MPIFEQGDVIRVPFPYTDRNTRQHRPAVVVSNGPVGDQGALLLVAMVTSARNRAWPGDCLIEAYTEAGLPKPSMVRPCKLTTIEVRDAERLGRLPDALANQVVSAVVALLGR
jgi:mRNA interferase MazF